MVVQNKRNAKDDFASELIPLKFRNSFSNSNYSMLNIDAKINLKCAIPF